LNPQKHQKKVQSNEVVHKTTVQSTLHKNVQKGMKKSNTLPMKGSSSLKSLENVNNDTPSTVQPV
jgi:hypothetical protein